MLFDYFARDSYRNPTVMFDGACTVLARYADEVIFEVTEPTGLPTMRLEDERTGKSYRLTRAPTLAEIEMACERLRRSLQTNARDQVFVKMDTPQWSAWQQHLRETRGKGTPHNDLFGWFFPSEWPPGHAKNKAAAGKCDQP